jgi:hypothetical protein
MVRARTMQRSVILFFILYTLLVVYPGPLLLRGPRPFILGLPLPLVWVALWIIGGFVVLLMIDRVYAAAESDAAARND